jgi:hypothetical protein
MKTNKQVSSIAFAAAIVVITVALSPRARCQAVAVESPGAGTSSRQWSVQVDQIDSSNVDLAYSFQVAIYENLVDELNKTKRFQHVFRDGDRRAGEVPNLLVLKTTVEKYTRGSETRRAVTSVSGATKLTVRTQFLTLDGKVAFERTVDGNVRFFGSNLRATHNLAHNMAKAIKRSAFEPPSAIIAGQL